MKEKIQSFHVSRLKFFSRYAVVVVLLALGIAGYRFGYSYIYYIPSIIVAIIGLIIVEIKLRSNGILLEKTGIIIGSGYLSKNVVRVNYDHISDIRIRQSFFQRIFGYGDIEIGVQGASLQQNFSGKGDVKIDPSGLHSGVVLKKFQNVASIERNILSRMQDSRIRR